MTASNATAAAEQKNLIQLLPVPCALLGRGGATRTTEAPSNLTDSQVVLEA